MCGFAGFVDNIKNKEEVLKEMMDAIIHRGPDQCGEYIDENVSLGFRRLSIIDLNNGMQPLFNEDNSLVLIFNGEIYNHHELREDLKKKGHVFRTHTDSEVLIHGYEEYKEDIVNFLRGMFAFCIWDTKEKSLFIARDHFGIKPLYYSLINNNGNTSFLFGSEIKSFLKHPMFKKEVNKEALKPYLTFQYSVLEETFFKGVFKLMPGHYLTYKNNKLNIKKYYDIEFNEKNLSLDESINMIDKAVKESVKAHSESEVPIASFLSGGIDSSYITACLKPSKTFSVGFEDEKFNESNLAKDLCDIIGIENVQRIITPQECFDKLETIQYHMDEPQSNPSSVPLYFLSELAREHVTVVLSGEGADEIFGGYEWYDDDLKLKKYKKLPYFIRRPIAKISSKMPYFKGRTSLIRGGSTVEESFIGQAFIFEENEASNILKPDYKKSKSIQEITKPYYDKVFGKDDLTKKQYLDLKLWLQGDILLKADKMSMAHSIELRVPFLDKEVMKVGAMIPKDYKINEGTTKFALREASNRILPEEWAKRKKKGFPVPIREWFKDEKYYNLVKESFTSDYASEFFETDKIVALLDDHFNLKTNNARKIYTIYTFLIWYKKFFVDIA